MEIKHVRIKINFHRISNSETVFYASIGLSGNDKFIGGGFNSPNIGILIDKIYIWAGGKEK